MTLDEQVRSLVRDELARLLGPERDAQPAKLITDLDRQRARAARRRAGVAIGPERTRRPGGSI
jgi:hypothetical protein